MRWLIEACQDSHTKSVSSARIVSLLSGATLSLCTLWLTVAAFWRIELVPALTVFGGSLATQAGASFVATKLTERKKQSEPAP